MATTTNFGWETPDDTDLVKDGALAMRTLGNSIDTSFVDLKGGTTGQNLRKATNTDLDFTWAGDATNTVVDAAGDLLYGSAADTLSRLAIGTTGQVLTVSSGLPVWASPAGGGKVLQIVEGTLTTEVSSSSSTLADVGLSASITPSATSSKILVYANMTNVEKTAANASTQIHLALLRGTTIIRQLLGSYTGTALRLNIPSAMLMALDSPNTTSSTTYKIQMASFDNTAAVKINAATSVVEQKSTIILMEIGA